LLREGIFSAAEIKRHQGHENLFGVFIKPSGARRLPCLAQHPPIDLIAPEKLSSGNGGSIDRIPHPTRIPFAGLHEGSTVCMDEGHGEGKD